jgi:hypothetical protein
MAVPASPVAQAWPLAPPVSPQASASPARMASPHSAASAVRVLPYNGGRSIVVVGKTWLVHEGLTNLGGKFKAALDIGGARVKGWEFDAAKRASVELFLATNPAQSAGVGMEGSPVASPSRRAANPATLTVGADGRLLIGGNTFSMKENWKALGGQWRVAEKVWSLPASARPQVEALLAAPPPSPRSPAQRARGHSAPRSRYDSARDYYDGADYDYDADYF